MKRREDLEKSETVYVGIDPDVWQVWLYDVPRKRLELHTGPSGFQM